MRLRRVAALLAAAVILVMDQFPPWAEWVSFVILVLLFIWPLMTWICASFWVKPRTFALRFYSEATRRELATWRFQPGVSDCEILIHVRKPLHVTRWSVRPVQTKRGGNIDPSILRVQHFYDTEKPQRSPNWVAQLDSKGGVEVIYTPPAFRAPSESMRFKLTMVACQTPWSGYFSLRSYDEDGDTRYSRIECHVDPAH